MISAENLFCRAENVQLLLVGPTTRMTTRTSISLRASRATFVRAKFLPRFSGTVTCRMGTLFIGHDGLLIVSTLDKPLSCPRLLLFD